MTLVRKNRTILSIFITVVAIAFFTVQVSASSYDSSGDFKVSMTSPWREFNENNITIETWATSSGTNYTITDFTVKLQRKTWYGYTTVGTATLPKEGYGKATWTNVGAGTYRLYYSRANDGGLQKITKAHIYSYN